ncbi:sugar kinase [Pelosinus sp. sgz500959]|uniref:sugar kinase n=1 Tax=Pelosinus sp. sgz500959 TaxID=3242472 RepID=UPI00366D0955
MPEIITIGESMVMLIADQGDPLEFVSSFSRHVAGAESNVAIGLARLGHQSGWISSIGNDPFGTYIRNSIRGEGVDTSAVVTSTVHPTGLLVKERNDAGDPAVYYYRRHSAASYFSPDMLQESYFENGKIFHITGIFPALSATSKETLFAAIKMAKSRGMLISFDPNIRLKLWTAEEAKTTLLEIAALSDLILPGLHEAELLVGTTEWEKVSAFFHEKGNRFVIMKNGAEGAYYSIREEDGSITTGYEEGFKVSKVVDTVGAGDGFAVGVLSAMHEGLSFGQAVKRGNAIGSMAVMVRGDSDGYPTRKKLEAYLSK